MGTFVPSIITGQFMRSLHTRKIPLTEKSCADTLTSEKQIPSAQKKERYRFLDALFVLDKVQMIHLIVSFIQFINHYLMSQDFQV